METVTDASDGSSTGDRSDDIDLTDVETSADLVLELGLTEPEFVMRFLEAHDGKVEQQAFVDQLDWSESKISRLLKSIEDDGRLVRLRKGRKKIVYTPERAPNGDPFAHLDDDRGAGSAGNISDAIAGEAVR